MPFCGIRGKGHDKRLRKSRHTSSAQPLYGGWPILLKLEIRVMVLAKLIQFQGYSFSILFSGEFCTGPTLAGWYSPHTGSLLTSSFAGPRLEQPHTLWRSEGAHPVFLQEWWYLSTPWRVSSGQEGAQAIPRWASLPLTERVRSSLWKLRSSCRRGHRQGQSLFLKKQQTGVLRSWWWRNSRGKDPEWVTIFPGSGTDQVFVEPEPIQLGGALQTKNTKLGMAH